MLDAVKDLTGLNAEEAFAYILAAAVSGGLEKLLAELEFGNVEIAGIIGAMAKVAEAVKSGYDTVKTWPIGKILFTATVFLLGRNTFANKVIFRGPADADEVYATETGAKGKKEAWKKDARKRNTWERYARALDHRFPGRGMGAVAKRAGWIGVILSILAWQDQIIGSGTYTLDKLFDRDRTPASKLRPEDGTKLYDIFADEYTVTGKGKKVILPERSKRFGRKNSDTQPLPLKINTRDAAWKRYYIQSPGGKRILDWLEKISFGYLKADNLVNHYVLYTKKPTKPAGWGGGAVFEVEEENTNDDNVILNNGGS